MPIALKYEYKRSLENMNRCQSHAFCFRNELNNRKKMTLVKFFLLVVCGMAAAGSYGTSKTSVSKPHQGKFDYSIDHSKHGSWHGSAHPHGYGGLGDGHGGYKHGNAHVVGFLPQGGHGGDNVAYGGASNGHGHATSSANFNLKAISHGHY